jgi:hypothetical protein
MNDELYGRRLERLLLFSAPILLASSIVLLFTVASTAQIERKQGMCLEVATKALSGRFMELGAISDYIDTFVEEEWNKRTDVSAWCMGFIRFRLRDAKSKKEHPMNTIIAFTEESKALLAKPISVIGITIPQQAKIEVLGAEMLVPTEHVISLLKAALYPAMILWLGSLFTTRRRELMSISKAKSLDNTFPHIINLFPVVEHRTTPRKYKRVRFNELLAARILTAALRVLLVATIVGFPAALYAASIVYSANGGLQQNLYFAIIAGGVAALAFIVIILELLPRTVRISFDEISSE